MFELLTATYAADPAYFAEHGVDFHLPDEWRAVRERLAYHEPVNELDDTDFLRAICLVSTHFARKGRPGGLFIALSPKRLTCDNGCDKPAMNKPPGTDPFAQPAASCKRADILTLPLQEYIQWSPEIESALEWQHQRF